LFSSPLPATNNQAKQDTCGAACAHIVRKSVVELEWLEDIVSQWTGMPEEDNSRHKVGGTPEGEPQTVNDGAPSNMDNDMSDAYFSDLEGECSTHSACKNVDQLEGPLSEILRTNNLFLAHMHLLSKNSRRTQEGSWSYKGHTPTNQF
jgi:hypothetical protein